MATRTKRIMEMTDEEAERRRQQWRDGARRYKQRLISEGRDPRAKRRKLKSESDKTNPERVRVYARAKAATRWLEGEGAGMVTAWTRDRRQYTLALAEGVTPADVQRALGPAYAITATGPSRCTILILAW